MKKHAMKMVKFTSQLRALMDIAGISTTNEIGEFLRRRRVFKDFEKISDRIDRLNSEDGFFTKFLSFGCSSNQPVSTITTTLSTDNAHSDENFCYHRRLCSKTLELFSELHYYFSSNLKDFGPKKSDFFNKFDSPQQFSDLTQFRVCACVHVAHQRLDFHSSISDGHAFLPALLISSRLISPIFWTPKILDFSDVGFPSSDFEVRFIYS